MKILIVEDDPLMVKLVDAILESRWPEVSLISTHLGKEGVELVKKEIPDLVVLDLMLPDIDGFHVLRQIRAFSDVPLVIITAKGGDDDKIRGLEDGADDYIVKPFTPGEFVARLGSLLRRSQMPKTPEGINNKPSTPPIKGKLKIDFASQEVSVGDKLLKLAPREYELLQLLVANEGEVVSNQTLLEKVFPENKDNVKFLDVYMKKLREALEEVPDNPKMVLNEGTTGYKFVGS